MNETLYRYRTTTRMKIPVAEVTGPCGFQDTFFECTPDHRVVVVRRYGWSTRHAMARARHWVNS